MMNVHFKAYVDNLNRVRLAELIDHHAFYHRSKSFKASLIANPLTGLPYNAEQDAMQHATNQPTGRN